MPHMKPGPYLVTLLLAVACVGLTVALILMEHTNQQLQVKAQAQQQVLNQGILGQQAQQISSGVLQDMAGAAAGNPEIRQLLEKHGCRVQPSIPQSGEIELQGKKQQKSANTEEPEP